MFYCSSDTNYHLNYNNYCICVYATHVETLCVIVHQTQHRFCLFQRLNKSRLEIAAQTIRQVALDK